MLSKACLSLHLVRVALAVFDTIVEGEKKPEMVSTALEVWVVKCDVWS